MSSFDDAILQEPQRFIDYAFNNNFSISDFGSFKNALLSALEHPHGEIDEQTFIDLFENAKTKNLIRENVTKEELENLYGDGNVIFRQRLSKTKMVKIVVPKVKVKSHTKNGKQIPAYVRGKSMKWTPVQQRFLKVRKLKKISPKQMFQEYNLHFKDTPRTLSSIRSKSYRL